MHRLTKYGGAGVRLLVPQQPHDKLRRRSGDQRYDGAAGEDQHVNDNQRRHAAFRELLVRAE